MIRRRRMQGQASIEALAAVPLLVVAVLIGWQLTMLVRGALIAQDEVRRKALADTGTPGRIVRVERRVRSVLPGVGVLRIRASARVPEP